MSKEIIITIITKIKYTDNTNEVLKNKYEGLIFLKGNEYYIRYQETTEHELGKTFTILKWDAINNPKNITIIRQGDTKMKQVYQKGIKDVSEYRNVYGAYEIEVDTNKVTVEEFSDISGKIKLDYDMSVNYQLIGNYKLEIKYTEKNSL